MKSIYYDFEYFNTSQPTLSVVCCAVLIIEKDKQPEKKAFWLENTGMPNETAAFKQFIEENKNELFFSYNVIAEAGAMYSLGFDPTKFQWVDIMSEWKQVRNGNHTRLYGKYICPKGKKKVSTPPEPPQYGELVSSKDKKIKGVNNSHTGTGLLSCVYHYTDVDLGYEHKKKMQNRILQGGPFSEKEAKEILEYSISDVEYLSIVMKKIAVDNCRLARIKPLTYIENAKIRGEWSARLAVMERIGIPVNTTWLYNIAKNHDKIKDKMCSILCATTYPFYEKEKEKGGFKWVMKKTAFEKFLKDNKLESEWPKTDKGNYKTDSETLADFEHFTEILEFRRVKDSLGQIRSFNKLEGLIEVNSYGEDEYVDNPNTEGLDNIFARIGKDKRLRCYFNPYGTQTSRNAPPSRNFIFAMSAWIRSAVQPPPGYAITAIDYSSEEFIIAACESKDKVMEKVYDSGDVYLGFAKIADPKRVPAHATKDSHGIERDMFKSTCLARGSPIRVKGKGFVSIEYVTSHDEVWDGKSWRKCKGSIYMGDKKVMPMGRFFCTGDHKILVNGEWKYAAKLQTSNVRSSEELQRSIHIGTTSGLHEAPANWEDVWALACSIFRSYLSRKTSLRSR